MNKKTLWLFALGFVTLVLAGCGAASSSSDENIALAECMTAKGAIMYGTDRCPHCQNQKKLFGFAAFEKINFVDCDKEKNVCNLAWVQGYPTWKFADGTVLQGTQTLETLAATTSCRAEDLANPVVLDKEPTTGDVVTGDVEPTTGDALSGVVIQEVSTTGTSGTGA